jgi:hypothetical protein
LTPDSRNRSGASALAFAIIRAHLRPSRTLAFPKRVTICHPFSRDVNIANPDAGIGRLDEPSTGEVKWECLPRFGQRAGVASAGAVLKREKYTASASWFLLNASGNQPPKIGSLTLQQAGRVCGMDTQRTRVSGYCREGAKAQSAVCSVREALYIPRGGGTVDAGDLKSSGATHAGSNPALGT